MASLKYYNKITNQWEYASSNSGSSDILIDNTLTQAGQAADAKAVGDALAEKQPKGNYALKSEIPNVDDLQITLDNKANKSEGAFYIEGSGTTDATAKTSTWVGTSDRITEYYDGLTIRYKIGVAGQSTVTLNINELGAKTVYRFNTTKLTTQFPVGSIVNLIYHADLNNGCWITNDYDANTNTYQRVYASTTNKEYPITARYNNTTGETYYAEYGRYTTGVTLNPSTNTITATTFKGKLTGNADTATKATQDADGNSITDTYETKANVATELSEVNNQITQLSEEKANKSGLTLGVHTDGFVYLFIDGAPQGNGLDIKTDVVEGDVFGYVDENNNIVLNGALAEGTYTIKYEMDNGNVVEIGQLTLDTNVYYSITNNLTNCTSNNSATQVAQGGSYSATITANSGYELSSITVTMEGTGDISADAVSDGNISIANVTGDIEIIATATASAPKGNLADPTSEDWLNDTRLAQSYGYGKECAGCVFTNYIPAKAGDVLRVKGLNLYSMVDGSNHAAVAAYTSTDKTADTTGKYNAYQRFRLTSIKSDTSGGSGAKEQVAADGDIYTYTILLNGDGTQAATSDTAYIRISAALTDGYTAEDVIITINEEITSDSNGYTNLLPLAVDASDNDYKGTNGEDGYKSGYKISVSSGDESSTSDAFVSGFIPINGKTIRIKNITVSDSASVNNLVFYNASKTKVGGYSGGAGTFTNTVTVTDGVYLINLGNWFSSSNLPAFFRFSCGLISDDTIVTVDEEINDAAQPTNFIEYNATNTTDWNLWCNNARVGSDGLYRSSTTQDTSNYIAVQNGDIIHWKNMPISNQMIGFYKSDTDSNKVTIAAQVTTNAVSSGYITDCTTLSALIFDGQFTINNDAIKFIRFTINKGDWTLYDGENVIVNIERDGEYL